MIAKTAETKHFTSRQMLLLLGVLMPLSRMILFPSSLAFSCGTGGILVVFIHLLLELLVVFAVIYIWKKTQSSFFDLIARLFSISAAKVVAVLYFLLFLQKSLIVLTSQKLMMYNVLYENVSSYILFLPIPLMLLYAGIKNSNSVARVFEISAGFVLVAFIGIMALSVPAINFENYFPISIDGANILQGVYSYFPYFGDFTFFLIFYSETRRDFKSPCTMLWGWAINFAITICFILVFFGVFGKLACGGTYATSNLSKYTVSFSQIGRYDFLFVLVVGLGFVLLALAIFHAMLCCGEYVVGKRWILSVVFAIFLYIAIYFTSQNFEAFSVLISKYTPIFCFIMQVLLPLVMWIAVAISKDSKMETRIKSGVKNER